MTITDNGRRSPEQILAQARQLVADGPLPSKTGLQKALGVAWRTASDIHDTVSRELTDARAQRRRRHRATLAALPVRKRSRGPRVVVVAPSPTPSQITVPATDQATAELGGKNSTADGRSSSRRPKSWPIFLLALPAFVAIWSGWVDLGRLTGFGVVHPFPGIWDEARLNTAITLPIGLETYAAYALYVWLSGVVPPVARAFAKWSAIGSLVLGAGGQVAYHLMIAAGMTSAPWLITTVVSCLPVAVLGMGAALRHLCHVEEVNE